MSITVGGCYELAVNLPGHSAGNTVEVLTVDPTGVVTVETAHGDVLSVMPGDLRPTPTTRPPSPREGHSMTNIQATTLRALREHMTGIIWEHNDMSIREARFWFRLLSAPKLSAKRARILGFDFIERPADIAHARAALWRFICAFQ